MTDIELLLTVRVCGKLPLMVTLVESGNWPRMMLLTSIGMFTDLLKENLSYLQNMMLRGNITNRRQQTRCRSIKKNCCLETTICVLNANPPTLLNLLFADFGA